MHGIRNDPLSAAFFTRDDLSNMLEKIVGYTAGYPEQDARRLVGLLSTRLHSMRGRLELPRN